MNTFTGQKTKFQVKQPLLSLQRKDQSESQSTPISSPFHSIFRVKWLFRQTIRHVSLPNIILWAITGTCSCPGLHCKGRWEPGALPVPAIPSPCPCKHRCLGEPVNHNCSQHWQQEYPCISAPATLGKFVQFLLRFCFLLLQGLTFLRAKGSTGLSLTQVFLGFKVQWWSLPLPHAWVPSCWDRRESLSFLQLWSSPPHFWG